jgi:hypothetical protein
MAKDKKQVNASLSTSSIMENLQRGLLAAGSEVGTYPFTVWSKKRESGLFDKSPQTIPVTKPVPYRIPKNIIAESYKGFNVNMLKTGAQVPLQFILQQNIKNYLTNSFANSKDKHETMISGAAGAASGLITTAITYPADTMITKIATDTFNKDTIMKSKSSLYNGMGLALTRSAIGLGLTFPAYDFMRSKIAKDPNNPTTTETFISSSFGGICGQLGTNPIDVVKTRKQITTPGELVDKSIKIVKDIYAKEGVKGFYRGGLYNSGKMVAKFGPRATLFAMAPTIVENASVVSAEIVDKMANVFNYFKPKQKQLESGSCNNQARPAYK